MLINTHVQHHSLRWSATEDIIITARVSWSLMRTSMKKPGALKQMLRPHTTAASAHGLYSLSRPRSANPRSCKECQQRVLSGFQVTFSSLPPISLKSRASDAIAFSQSFTGSVGRAAHVGHAPGAAS